MIQSFVPSPSADTLPAKLGDAAFWKLITDFSEPDGVYAFQVVTSNNAAAGLHQHVIRISLRSRGFQPWLASMKEFIQ